MEECWNRLPLSVRVIFRLFCIFVVIVVAIGIIWQALVEPRGYHTLPNIALILIVGCMGLFFVLSIAFVPCRVQSKDKTTYYQLWIRCCCALREVTD